MKERNRSVRDRNINMKKSMTKKWRILDANNETDVEVKNMDDGEGERE